MNPHPRDSSGLIDSLRTFGDHFVEGAQRRLELFSVELQEEKFRLIRMFIAAGAVVFAAMLTLVFASLTLVYCFWETARLAVLGGLAVFYAVALVWAAAVFRRHLLCRPKPFSATLDELEKDRACIRHNH